MLLSNFIRKKIPTNSLVDWAIVEIKGNNVCVSLSFPNSPIYRPVIGFYHYDVLFNIVPSKRKITLLNNSIEWRCFAKSSMIPTTDIDNLKIILLETGQVLYDGLDRNFNNDNQVSVKKLMHLVNSSVKYDNFNGFSYFLKLSIGDQVDLIYTCYLKRSPNHLEAEYYSKKIELNDITILDLRDELISSDEFKRLYLGGTKVKIMNWALWVGVRELNEQLKISRKRFYDINKESDINKIGDSQKSYNITGEPLITANYIAKLALSKDSTQIERFLWKKYNLINSEYF